MKFALLGSDEEALALARAVTESGLHEMAARYEVSAQSGAAGIVESLDAPQRYESWEAVLLGTVADAVIVGRFAQPEQLDEPLRRLVQEAVPTLVVHPACSSLMALELEMIRGDTGALLLPYLPEAGHPAVLQLAAWAGSAEGPLGRIRQLVVERQMSSPQPEEVLRGLARDAHLVRVLLGEVEKVSALRGDGENLANLSVQMKAAGGVLVRWSAVSGQGQSGARLEIFGDVARATLQMNGQPGEWSLELAEEPHDLPGLSEWDPAAAAVADLSAAMEGNAPVCDWSDACRSMEIVEAVQRSLKRGRTIELFHEQPTEEETFKGMMAAGGCLLLMLSLLLLVAVGVLDGLKLPWLHEGGGAMLRKAWPLLLAVPLGLFTLLQLLRLVFPSPRRPAEDSNAADGNAVGNAADGNAVGNAEDGNAVGNAEDGNAVGGKSDLNG